MDEEYEKNLTGLVRARTEQLRACFGLNEELLLALKAVKDKVTGDAKGIVEAAIQKAERGKHETALRTVYRA
jgi:hypothetical protein